MNLTVRHIEWLLTMHNCVVIPRIGAVLAHTAAARISDDGKAILAPRRTYTFNAQVNISDGLLEQSIARANGISHNAATRIVNDDIDAMIAQLYTTGQLSLGRIGTLAHNNNTGSTTFEPFAKDSLSPLASWLPVIPAVAIGSDQDNANNANGITIAAPRPRWQRTLRGTAAAAAIVAITVVASTPISVDDASLASTALPPISGPRAAYIPSPETPVLNISIDDAQPIAVDTAARNEWQRQHLNEGFVIDNIDDDADNTTLTDDSEIVPGTTSDFVISQDHQFCVVVASFTTNRAAKQFIGEARHKYNGALGILHQGKRYHIYAASGMDEKAARAQLNNGLNNIFEAAWICQR